jgi:predicted pyridoxine 5'-phosphate oxidase superfamily flavin-nucleotide-binding protein
MSTTPPKSPFHPGEQEIQSRLGVRDRVENLGQRFIRDYLPDQHREFYRQLPMLLIGSVDSRGHPWASLLVGRPGFIHSPDPHSLVIEAKPIFGDPLNDNLIPGTEVGILGID